MRKIFIFVILMGLLLFSPGVIAAGEIGITINDEEVWLGVPPFIQDEQAIVPVRPLLEALNAQVAWDSENELALGIKGDNKVLFVTGETDLEEDVYGTAAKIPGLNVQGRTFAPLRPTIEFLGCNVKWDEMTRTIAIATENDNLPVEINSEDELLDFKEDEKIDVNSATFWELLVIEGIDGNVAQNILSYREKNGPFMSFAEMKKVDGVSDSLLSSLQQDARLVYYEKGYATSYGGIFHGRRTASGEIYNKYASTAAHPTLPFDTMVKATFLETGKSTWVRINDRGPCQVRHPDRIIDLSRSSAYEIGLTRAIGVGKVELKIVMEK